LNRVSKIHRIDIRQMTNEEWLAARMMGIGGSEIGGVLGLAPYTDPIKVYAEKIGEPVSGFAGNRYSNSGSYKEASICNLYQYWDLDEPDVDLMWDNYNNGNKLRRVQRVNAYLLNEKWHWLFASLDREVIGKRKNQQYVLVESKNTTGMEKKRYKYGVNRGFVSQIQQYLMITEADVVHLMFEIDGNDHECIPIEPSKEFFELIETESRSFWDRVLKAREIKKKYKIASYMGIHPDFIPKDQQGAIYELQALEPDLTGSIEELKFIRELVHPTVEFSEKEGTTDERKLITKYGEAGEAYKAAEANKNAIKSELILALGGYHVSRHGDGHFSYKPDKNGQKSIYISPTYFKEK